MCGKGVICKSTYLWVSIISVTAKPRLCARVNGGWCFAVREWIVSKIYFIYVIKMLSIVNFSLFSIVFRLCLVELLLKVFHCLLLRRLLFLLYVREIEIFCSGGCSSWSRCAR